MPDLFPYSVAFVLSNETFMRNGELISFYQNAVTDECSNFGISLAWFKGLKPLATCDDIKALTQEGATHLYDVYFWTAANLGTITLPMIAAKVFDCEVNQGAPQGIRLLQSVLGVESDGVLGPVTAAACNQMNEPALYGAFVRAATDRYQAIAAVQAKKYGQAVADKNLAEWLARVNKQPPAFDA